MIKLVFVVLLGCFLVAGCREPVPYQLVLLKEDGGKEVLGRYDFRGMCDMNRQKKIDAAQVLADASKRDYSSMIRARELKEDYEKNLVCRALR